LNSPVSPREYSIDQEKTMTAKLKLVLLMFLSTSVLMAAAQVRAPYQECTSTITGNFNGTAIAQGDYIWFTGVLTVKGLGTGPTTLYVSHASITFTANNQTYKVRVPSSTITFSSSTTTATTDFVLLTPSFLGVGWDTQLPLSGLAGNDLMTAMEFAVPAGGLPGGIKNVAFTATFSSFTAGLTVNWQWAAAAYTSFSTNPNALGVKPVDDNHASQYQNSDHAGTPENIKASVTGGATGGGGANFTGSYSATGSCALTPDSSSSVTVSK
jgi:hypothetical protein